MNLLEKIKKAQLQSRLDRSSVKTSILTTLIGEIDTVSKTVDRDVVDADVEYVIRKFIKNNDACLENIGVDDSRHSTYVEENRILAEFLPTQLTEDDLSNAINDIVTEHGSDVALGTIMKVLKDRFNGRYRGDQAAKIAKARLGA